MKKIVSLFTVLSLVSLVIILVTGAGCANIIPPSGGPRDTIPPILVAESPRDSATNIFPKRLTFVFNEYVELQNQQENILVSPNPNNAPVIDSRLRTVTVRIRDTLEPNTTYSINFGNAIKDINEGNVFKDFSYVFSTGNHIDSFTLSGKVTLAETGKLDTTLVAILHKNTDDSAIIKEKPRYIAKLDGSGNFTFRNLPAGTFALYALPNDYGHRYNETKLFAFADKPVVISDSTPSVNLFAYLDSTRPPAAVAPATNNNRRSARDTTLRFSTNLQAATLNILAPLQITFPRKIATFDSTKIALTNATYDRINNYTITEDTSATKFYIRYNWPPNTPFNLIIAPGAFVDSAGVSFKNTDTLRITTRTTESYGSIKLRFNNLDTSKHPVLLLLQSDQIVQSVPITQRDWIQKLIEPGEYEVRILYDENRNGKWDKGQFFGGRRQPERVKFVSEKITVRENWDNEREIGL